MIIVLSKIDPREARDRIVTRFRGRSLEWEHATMKMLFGLIVMLNPAILDGPGFAAFPKFPLLIGGGLLFVGTVHIAALCINGYIARPTALLRASAAMLNIIVFALISLGFLFSWRFSTWAAVYPVVAFYSLFSLRWAVVDVAIPDHHDEARPRAFIPASEPAHVDGP